MMNGALERRNKNYNDFYYVGFPLDVTEEDNEYVVACEMPGVVKENIHISFLDGILSITAKKMKNKEDGKYLIHERSFMNMKREINFGDIDSEAISAKLDNGLLEVHVKKNVKEAKSIMIE